MNNEKSVSTFTLFLLISFASVNAVLFTPALPAITTFFKVSDTIAQQLITGFLIGYTIGQLIYGPIANRFGRKPTLYTGIIIQILSSLLCILASKLDIYFLLVLGRFFLALGSGVGLKMTFTLLNEYYTPNIVSQKLAYLMIAFAIAPGLSVAIGGVLTTHFGWESCFYAGMVYGIVLLCLIPRLPETLKQKQLNALNINHIKQEYSMQFKNKKLVLGSFLMGSTTAIIYIFAAIAPFVAINLLGMSTAQYGMVNILLSVGLVIGSLFSVQYSKKHTPNTAIKLGILIIGFGCLAMLLMFYLHRSALLMVFLPMVIIYLGFSLVYSNASALAMSAVADTAHASAVMSFINMAYATAAVLVLSNIPTTLSLLPVSFLSIIIIMIILNYINSK